MAHEQTTSPEAEAAGANAPNPLKLPPRRLRVHLSVLLPCCLSLLLGLAIEVRSAAQDGKSLEVDEPAGSFVDPPALVWDAADATQDARWEFKDPQGWRFSDVGGQRVLSQFRKASDYQPPHRSPLHIALWKEEQFDSFQMDVWVKSTHSEYGHRDVCLFFGYAAPDRFYYVHLASEMDDRANQIFVVDAADRVKISESTTSGTRWDDEWHHVRIQRNHHNGKIHVFFDNMEKPIMTAVHTGTGAGQIGFGSFDDTADFRRLEIRRWQP